MKIANKIRINLFVLTLFALLTTACNFGKSAVKEQYSKDDLTFSHFSDWKVKEDKTTVQAVGEARYVTVEGPDNAFLMISRFPGSAVVTLESYVELLQKGMSEESKNMTGGVELIKVDAGNLMPVENRIGGAASKGLAREFDIKAFGVPVPHRAETYLVETADEKWFLVAQSPKEDWDDLQNGFQIIYESFSTGQSAPQSGGQSSEKKK